MRLFRLNRSLTGMAVERYKFVSPTPSPQPRRPPDVLARRLFALGATRVTIASNVVTVEAPRGRWSGMERKVIEAIERLFGYYGDDAGWSPEALGHVDTGDGEGDDSETSTT